MELYIAGSELPENPVVDIDFSFDDDEMLDEEMRADKELEVKMAKQTYELLRDSSEISLSKNSFKKWEDISDLLGSGAFDDETLEIIYKECGVVGDSITFDQFLEIVDLVNQVAAVLDQDMQEVLGENLESELVDETEVDEPYNVPDLSWMLAGMVEKKEKP